jgi:hypothetical protein
VRGPPVIAQAVRLSVALPTCLTLQGEGPVHSQVMLADPERAPDLVCDSIDLTSIFTDRDPPNPDKDPKEDPQQLVNLKKNVDTIGLNLHDKHYDYSLLRAWQPVIKFFVILLSQLNKNEVSKLTPKC